MRGGRNRRKASRRLLNYPAMLFASDGSWGRNCCVLDISDTGARLRADEPGTLPGFFILAFGGAVQRRCHVVWCEKNQVGVRFETPVAG